MAISALFHVRTSARITYDEHSWGNRTNIHHMTIMSNYDIKRKFKKIPQLKSFNDQTIQIQTIQITYYIPIRQIHRHSRSRGRNVA